MQFSLDLKGGGCCPQNYKLLGINNYDGSTNPTEWLAVYQLTITATGGDTYGMANYLLICRSSLARTWLMGLPTPVLTIHQQLQGQLRATRSQMGLC
jgi:hypothetical protein